MPKKAKKKVWKEDEVTPLSTVITYAVVFSIVVILCSNVFTYRDAKSKGYSLGLVEGRDAGFDEMRERTLDYIQRESSVSCDGIENYFTNTSFLFDWSGLMKDYNRCVDDNDIVGFIGTPQDLFECKPYLNCDSISHIISCLQDFYNTECKFYYSRGYSDVNQELSNHIGIYCYVEGSWERLN